MNAPLPEAFLQTLVAEMDSDEVTAIILGGSHARGTATRYSDVDFARFVRTPPQGQTKRYFYRDGHLISVVSRTLAYYEESLTRPELAIWRVPSMRDARILLDKEEHSPPSSSALEPFAGRPCRSRPTPGPAMS